MACRNSWALNISGGLWMWILDAELHIVPLAIWHSRVSRVLIDQHLIFCSYTWSTCCNTPRKCTPVKYKVRQKAGFPIVTYTTSQEKVFLEISQNSQENNCVRVPFLIKLQAKKKRDSGTGAFLWILWNF